MSISYVLGHYQQNFDDPYAIDVVRTTVTVYDNGAVIGGRDLALSNRQLTEHAEAQGRATWDERDVALLLSAHYETPVYLPEPATVQPEPATVTSVPIVLALPEPTEPVWYVRWWRKLYPLAPTE